jgi:hypothetical protein
MSGVICSLAEGLLNAESVFYNAKREFVNIINLQV